MIRIILTIIFVSSTVFAVEPKSKFGPYQSEDVARRLCLDVFNSRDFVVEAYFDEPFQNFANTQRLKETVGLAVEAAGYCLSSTILQKSDEGVRALLQTAYGNQVTVDFSHNEQGLVKTLNVVAVDLPTVRLRNWLDVDRWISLWPGLASMTVARLDSAPLEMGNQDVGHPIEGTFKLYVLRALEEEIYQGRRKWTDAFQVRTDWKSVPGPLEWPQGQSVTLEQFAHAMMKYDDNTATDHLMRILGREAIEKALVLTQHQHPEWNIPVLRTDEFFKLKWGAQVDVTQRYLRATVEERRTMLDREISTMGLNSVGKNGLSMTVPTWIRQVEWFASTSDMCRAMRSFLTRKDAVSLKSMTLDAPLKANHGDSNYWNYVGFKAGSEPGVLTTSYLLLDRYGRWSCLSAAWSNDKRVVNPWLFYDAVQKSLNML